MATQITTCTATREEAQASIAMYRECIEKATPIVGFGQSTCQHCGFVAKRTREVTAVDAMIQHLAPPPLESFGDRALAALEELEGAGFLPECPVDQHAPDEPCVTCTIIDLLEEWRSA